MLGPLHVFRIWRAVTFLFMAPFILAVCFIVNWMTYHGDWWVRWVALGLGIAWFASLFRVIRAVVILGGIAALATYLAQRKTNVPPPPQ